MLSFALESEAGLKMPAGWSLVANRFSTAADPAVRGAYEQLAALFGDKTVLVVIRSRLADTTTPLAERRRALDLLKRAGDTESTALLVRLLADKDLRAAVIPLLGTAADSAVVVVPRVVAMAALRQPRPLLPLRRPDRAEA